MLKTHDIKRLGANLIWQPLLALVFIACVLILLCHFHTTDLIWALGAGSLSSTAYIVFASPKSNAAKPRNIVGGYCIAVLCGAAVQLVIVHFGFLDIHRLQESVQCFAIFYSAVVVGLVIFLMSVFQFDHPPAAGLSLVVVIDMRSFRILIFLVLCSIVIARAKRLLAPYLKNLSSPLT